MELGELSFRNELRIPPLADPVASEPGRKVFHFELQDGVSELLPGTQTESRWASASRATSGLHDTSGNELARVNLIRIIKRLEAMEDGDGC